MRGYAGGRVVLVATFALLAHEAHTQDLGLALPSLVRIAAGADSEGGNDVALYVDYGLDSGQRLTLAYGRSQSVEDDVELEPQLWELGVGGDPLLPDLGGEIGMVEMARVNFVAGAIVVQITGDMSDLNPNGGVPDRDAFVRIRADFEYDDGVEAALGPFAWMDEVTISMTFNG